ncbi:MAG: DUF1874 domain-containing protein [Elusimicrobiales bacterium]|nr:DUF1874 domain-containing protein [Elusimicrobiales bacterium]
MTLVSSFSLSMVEEYPAKAEFEEVSVDYIKKLISENKIVFKIGHPSYASVLSEIFGVKIYAVREKLVFKKGESFVVAQIMADRLPEGKVLTEEEIKKLKIKFVKVSLK